MDSSHQPEHGTPSAPSTQSTQMGGKFLGRGSYGCVFYPHLRCTRPKDLKNKTAIGKVFVHADDFKEEMIINKIVGKIDPKNEFTLPNFGACVTHPFQAKPSDELRSCSNIKRRQDANAEVYQILYQFGGPDLFVMSMDPKHTVKLDDVMRMLLPIMKGVSRMHAHGYSHYDIKPENMLYETKKKRIVLIDFGLLTPLYHIYENDKMLSESYPYYPPEQKLYYALKTKMRRSEWIPFLISGYTRYPEIFDVLESFDYGMTRIEDLIERATNMSPKKFMTECRTNFAEKVDVFSLGMSMIELFKYMEHKITDFAFVNGFIHRVVLPMVDFNPFTRTTLANAIANTEDYLKNYQSIYAHEINLSLPVTPQSECNQTKNKTKKTLCKLLQQVQMQS